MDDEEKSKAQLVAEVIKLRQRVEMLEEELQQVSSQALNDVNPDVGKYQEMLEQMDEAYFETDQAGNITFFNRAALEMVGYTADEFMGMNSRQYIPPDEYDRLFKIYNRIYQTGQPALIFEYAIIRKDGRIAYRETSASLLKESSNNKNSTFMNLSRDITKRKLYQEAYKENKRELKIQSLSLSESNTALKVLLKQREGDRADLERDVLSNVREMITPYLEKLQKSRLSDDDLALTHIIEANLTNIISPFLRNLSITQCNLTPKELQVANLVKEGRTTKEIADFLNISTGAIDFHRNSIRKKLGLNKKKANLRSYLLSLT
ncbi:MAG: PAS domain S-box protein [Deltaproteobacteria bacterium]|nr:PAS domain S-box protein [Deltaproteobacteria bacterium]